MKKILAILLALVLVLVSAAALAADGDPATGTGGKTIDVSKLAAPTAAQELTIKKNYTVTATEGAELPPDELEFERTTATVEDGPYTDKDMPLVSIAKVPVAGGNTLSYDVKLNLPAYEKVGVFYYEFNETDHGVAGVTYIKNKITVRVTVIQDEVNNKLVIAAVAIREEGVNGASKDATTGKTTYDLSKKVDSLENTYEAGGLKLEKEVTGNMGEYGKVWNFTITLTAPTGKTVYSKITSEVTGDDSAIIEIDGTETTETIVAAGTTGWTSKEIKVTLAHEGTITFKNIPAGVTYEIEEAEADADGYETTPEGDSGTIAAGEISEAKFTNDKTVEIDTGITMETVPYIMILALALIGAAMMIIRKREEY